MDEVEFQMPPCYVGLMVHWYSGGKNVEPVAAIITRRGTRSTCVWILPAGSHNGLPKDGVRHLSDPVQRPVDREAGFWDYIPAKDVAAARAAVGGSTHPALTTSAK